MKPLSLKKHHAVDKKHRKWMHTFIATLALIAIIAFIVDLIETPLDAILLYEVDVVPQDDGAAEITYHLHWEVLDDVREGPLTWIAVGMANPNFTVLEASENVSVTRVEPSGLFARIDLDTIHRKGDIAEFQYTVRQERLLYSVVENGQTLVYDFTPGWFNEVDVRSYRFTWCYSPEIGGHNADLMENGILIWEGALSAGQKRTMHVRYPSSAFHQPALAGPAEAIARDGSYNHQEYLFIVPIVIVYIIVLTSIWNGSGYWGGAGYGGYRSGPHGTGCACACACAGCACACACAGGGRAGCSEKDFLRIEETASAWRRSI